MHVPSTNLLLLIFVGVAALALLGQWLTFLTMARRMKALSEAVMPALQPLEQGARALPGLARDAQALLTEVRVPLQKAAANVLEISAITRDRVKAIDKVAGDVSERLELQMVRVDEALTTALASVEQVTAAVRDGVLRPVQDVNALVQGVRTGVDFFFRRRAGTPGKPAYQDEEMFI